MGRKRIGRPENSSLDPLTQVSGCKITYAWENYSQSQNTSERKHTDVLSRKFSNDSSSGIGTTNPVVSLSISEDETCSIWRGVGRPKKAASPKNPKPRKPGSG